MQNQADMQAIAQLESLIDKIKESGLRIVVIEGINNGTVNSIIPPLKNHADSWYGGKISDSEFLNDVRYLINEKVIAQSTFLPEPAQKTAPSWLKNTAHWWAIGSISNSEFLNCIEFLVNQGIIMA